jgi:hypothetical protein
MRRKNLFLFLFLILSIVNLCIFFYRDHFRYQTYTNYQSFYGPCDETCRNKWESYVDDYPEAEIDEAKKISDAVVKGKTSSFDKVLSIGHFLRRRFEKQLGKPTLELLASSPLSQFKKLNGSDTPQLWCGNFAQMFSYFCWSQGIVSRNIEIMKAGDHHVISECYIPEKKQWIMVDLTNNILAANTIENKDRLANFFDFRKDVSQNPDKSFQSMTVWRSMADSIVLTEIKSLPLYKYYNKIIPAVAYHSMDYLQKITTANKIRQYLLPVSWYEILSERKGSNSLFYLKLALLVLWVVSFFVFLISRTKFRI